MRPLAVAALLVLLGPAAAVAARAAEAPPSEAEVRALIARVEQASRNRDLEALGALLAADCRIELTTRIDGHEQVTLLTRDEYLDMLARGYASLRSLSNYDYRVSDLVISYDHEPPAATVVSQVRESFVFEGRPTLTVSRETDRLERRDGALKLVAVAAETQGR